MSIPPECQQLLISGYVLGNLSPKEALLFEEMLAENPALMEQVTVMQQTWDMAYTDAEVPPPSSLRDRILAAAQAEKTSLNPVKTDKNQERRVNSSKFKSVISQILGAIALGIITTLGIVNYRLWQSVQIAKTTDSQSDTLTYILRSQDATNNSTAKLVVNPDRLSAILQVDNLPPLPPEKAYALWTVVGKDIPYTTDDKGAILTAVFQVDESGDFTQEIAVPQPHLESRTIKKMAITVEDTLTPQAHQGSIFISTED